MTKHLFYFLLLACAGCARTPEAVYLNDIPVQTTENLVAEKLNDTFMFSWPRDLIIIDSFVVVYDSYVQLDAFHVFNKYSGANVANFAKKGRGPGEFIDINSVNNNHDGRSITAFDPNIRKAFIYDIINIVNDVEPKYQEVEISEAPNFVKQLVKSGDVFLQREMMIKCVMGCGSHRKDSIIYLENILN